MGKQIGKQTYKMDSPITIVATSTIVGKKEGAGPLKDYFEKVVKDDTMGEKSYEKAERKMMEECIEKSIENAGINENDVDLLVGGDLLNQLVTINYSARSFDIPFIGVYGACSNMTESLAIASCFLDGGFGKYIVCSTGSHFSSSERQFRTPLELGSQKQTYSQWTVTGMGSTILTKGGKGPRITMVTFGKVTDYGVKDIANMGAAMAPAAMNTLVTFFEETETKPEDYDLIVSGDLGKLGSDILKDLMKERGYFLGKNYVDCGHLIYQVNQKTFQGGSGAGCSAVVFNSYIYEKLLNKTFNKIVFMATGALMSTTTNQQGDTIPCIAHLVVVESGK